ncbi:MAG TPA: PepSY domain-containing protein [Methanobacterium sp.]|nr:PepSY domain-containing protein [Methanobacterium sp.]
MIKKSIIAMAAIIAVVGIVFAAGGAGHSNSTNSNDLEKQQNNGSNSNTNKSTNTSVTTSTAISATKAKEIAQKYIDQPGATAGTPELTKMDGKKVYIVPVIDNGQRVGEIDIDAQTGENLGGAGGAP